jgi:hypothetical protein
MSDNPEQKNPETPPVTPPPKWYMDEGIEGSGERPPWLHEKFKSVADLARSNQELEKRLGTVPEDYDFSKSRYLDPDYVPFHELKQVAKDKRVPQEVIDKMLESVDKYMDEFSIDDSEEIKKLGDNAIDRLTTLNNWAKANLSNDAYEALTSHLRSAESVKALEELRNKFMSNATQIPNGNQGAVVNPASVEDIKMEISNNLAKYKTDAAYRKDVSSRLEVAVKNAGGYIDKVGA